MPRTLTYDPALAAPRDRVRFLVGDRDDRDPQLDDAEIDYLLLANNGDELQAALDAAEGMLAEHAQLATHQMDAVQWQASDIFKQLAQLIDRLRARLARRGLRPYAGGLTYTDKQAAELDPDRVRPFFRRDRPLLTDARLLGPPGE